MHKKAILVLEDGETYEGYTFGSDNTTIGEVVFDTAMTGYQEMLTDPSFAGQILIPTFPLIGNYGINDRDIESNKIQVRGFVVREYCRQSSNWQSQQLLDDYLRQNNIPGIFDIDTRSLIRHIRSLGTMMGIMTSELSTQEAIKQLKIAPSYGNTDFVTAVSTEKSYHWENSKNNKPDQPHILIVDMGMKYNIPRILCQLGSYLTIVPVHIRAEDILAFNPDGILLSPGPGDPALLDYAIKLVKELIGKKPLMGICLGHQLIALALGAKTYKLKFGHRGGNHPVRDLSTGRIYITTQNHGYAVDEKTLINGLESSYINSNDGTVEGLRHKEFPIISIQFHAEGAPGPQDNRHLFQEFLSLIQQGSR